MTRPRHGHLELIAPSASADEAAAIVAALEDELLGLLADAWPGLYLGGQAATIHELLAGFPADNLVSLIDANEVEIEKGGVDLRSYIAPGQSHTVLSKPDFYTEVVEGVPLVEWVTDLIRRQPDPDVHCTDCT